MLLKLFEDLRDGNINPKQVLDNQASPPPPPQDFEILGWCPGGPILPQREKVPL